MNTPHDLVEDATGLISLPGVYVRVRELLDDPNSRMSDFAKVISTDPNIAIRVLRIANSAFFGFATKIDSLSRAVGFMGTTHLHDLVLGVSAAKSFSGIPNDIVDMRSFWRQSVLCGISARLLASQCNIMDSDRLFVAGLLHDIGHLLIYAKLPDLAEQAIRQSSEQNTPLFVIERKVLGFDYGQVGSELMHVWELPESYRTTTEFHLEPGKAPKFQIEAAIINIARSLASTSDTPQSPSFEKTVDPVVWGITGLSTERVDSIIPEANKHLAGVIELIYPN